MHILLNLAALGAVALPGAALAQTAAGPGPAPVVAPSVDNRPAPPIAPLPTVQPTVDAPPPVSAAPAPSPVHDVQTATPPTGPTTVPPVLVAKESNAVAGKVGVIAGGVAGGAAGAALAGPVGKFAGGFIGKKLVGGLLGDDKDKIHELTVISATPSADQAGGPAVSASATAPAP